MKSTHAMLLALVALPVTFACGGLAESASHSSHSVQGALTTALENGTSVQGLAGARNEEVHFSLPVSSGASQLRFRISGGSGDADLYVRFGAAPTRTQYDYRPYLSGNQELVIVPAPVVGTWFVMIRGYRAYQAVTLLGSFDAALSDAGTFADAGATDAGSADAGSPDSGTSDAGSNDAGAVGGDNPAFEDQVLVLVNQQRQQGATCGTVVYSPAAPLTMNPQLRSAARLHSDDMADQNYFSHTSLDGRTFSQRIQQAGYTGAGPRGENIAAGYSTPQAVVDGWMTSPGHCSNIMSGSYRALGIGYGFNSSSTFDQYWTQDFGGTP